MPAELRQVGGNLVPGGALSQGPVAEGGAPALREDPLLFVEPPAGGGYCLRPRAGAGRGGEVSAPPGVRGAGGGVGAGAPGPAPGTGAWDGVVGRAFPSRPSAQVGGRIWRGRRD